LYVGNIPYETSEAQLGELFGTVGQVESVHVMRDQATGRARGFAFVEMATDDDAQQAITQLNEKQFDGRALSVNEARPKPQFGGGGGYDRGGSGGGGYDRNSGGGGRRRSEPRW
jgi:RNA recognition motif-containing protein